MEIWNELGWVGIILTPIWLHVNSTSDSLEHCFACPPCNVAIVPPGVKDNQMETLTYPSSFETKKDVSLVFLIKSKRIKKPQQRMAGFLGKSACGMTWSWPQKWLRHSMRGNPQINPITLFKAGLKGTVWSLSSETIQSINLIKEGSHFSCNPDWRKSEKERVLPNVGTDTQANIGHLKPCVEGRSSFPPCLLSLQESGNPTP